MLRKIYSRLTLYALILALLGPGILLYQLQAQDEAAQEKEERSGNLKAWLGIDVVSMIATSDPVGKLSLLLLAGFSLGSWSIIIFKYLHIRQALVQTDRFVKACGHTSGQLDEAFKVAADYPQSPLAQLLREAYLELEIENWYRDGYNLDDAGRLDLAKISMERVFDRTIGNEITHLESKLIFLATTTSICPFIGLFGTVWGIMVAFQGFGISGSVSISALAPGLSTALLTTVGGLFCAIPASLAYNQMTNRVRILTARMDAFALELSTIIQKQMLKDQAN